MIAVAWQLVVTEASKSRGDLHYLFSSENLFKYPMMRRLLYDFEPIATPFLLWFDDDSYIKDTNLVSWLGEVETAMADADMIGSLYKTKEGYRGGQVDWIRSRPWYNGVPVKTGDRHDFATGGWWCLRTEVLYKYNWPDLDIRHRGGDVMLGELCRQQGLRLKRFKDGVAINADDFGRESEAKRRGHDEPPVGHSYRSL